MQASATMLDYRQESPPATVPDPTAPPAPPPPPAGGSAIAGKATMIGVAIPDAALAAARAQVTAAVGPPPPALDPQTQASMRIAGNKTMLGMAATPLAPPVAPPPAPAQVELRGDGPGVIEGAPSQARPGLQRTMIGVAIPGIAPRASETPAPPPSQAISPAAVSLRSGAATMLGVAMPGIAPTAPGQAPPPAPYAAQVPPAPPGPPQGPPPVLPQQPPPRAINPRLQHTAIGQQIVPAPAPFVDDEPVPSAPQRRAKRGVPVGIVAGIVGGLLLLGGGAIAFFYRGAPPIVAQPRLDAQGNEILHLRCENCPNGTVASLAGAKSTFQSSETDVPLTKPLDVGDNKLTVQVARPGVGRDEAVSLVVPVAFRIRADLADIEKKPPVITVRVAAVPGTDVKVDGKPLALDGTGKGSYAVDVSADTEGATDDQRVIDRKIPYAVTLAGGKPESGVVSARIGVVPLRIDAPSPHAVIDGATFTIAGQTAAGGAVTVDDAAITAQADGSFAEPHTAGAPGTPVSIEIRATASGRAPRTAHVTVKRGSLDAEAKAADAAGGLLTYDQIAADIASKAGQRAVVSGEVLEARVTGHQTIALVNDTRGCKTGPCLARVIASEDAKGLTRGAMVRAYGTVTRAVSTTTGKTIPEIEADFVARGK
jgi:hypothetical protein